MRKILFVFSIGLIPFLFSCKSTKAKAPTTVEKAPQETERIPEYDTTNEEEFSRSTHDVSISKETFSADKNAILRIIDELSTVMANRDYNAWLTYIEPESIEYWSSPRNLLQASKRLPFKGRRLNTLQDYFEFVFVPSRKGRAVDEIRYISLDSVKAVQMQDNQDIVYYNFVKKNGKWMVKIPPLQQ